MSTSWTQQWRLPMPLPPKALRETSGNAVAVCPSSVTENSTVSSEARSTERKQAAQPCLRPGPRAWSLSNGAEGSNNVGHYDMPPSQDVGRGVRRVVEKEVTDLDMKYGNLHVWDADEEVAWCHLMRVRGDNVGSSSTSAPLGNRVGWAGRERGKDWGMHQRRRHNNGTAGFQESEGKDECSVRIREFGRGGGGEREQRANGASGSRAVTVTALVPAIANDMRLHEEAMEKEEAVATTPDHGNGRFQGEEAATGSGWAEGMHAESRQKLLDEVVEGEPGSRGAGRHTEGQRRSADFAASSSGRVRENRAAMKNRANGVPVAAAAAVAFVERGIEEGSVMTEGGEQKVRKKKKRVWTGARTPRRTPPQKPWTSEFCEQKERDIAKSILELEAGATVGSVLDSWMGKLTRVDLCQVMRQLSARHRLDQALEVFKWAEGRTGRLRPNPHMCILVVGLLGRARRLSAARELFERTLRAKFDAELSVVHVFNAMMGACMHSGESTEAWSLFERMRSEGVHPDVVTYNTLLRACVRDGLPACALRQLVQRMRDEDGLAPDVRTYNTLLDGLRRERLWEQVAEILEEMREGPASSAPDQVTYNTAIAIYAKAGRPDEAFLEIARMRQEGLRPDLPAFTGLVEACSQAGRVREAFEVVGGMRSDGLEPDRHLWSVLVSTCGRAGLAAEAEGVVQEMRRSGCEPNIVTYGALVQAYARQGMFKDAARVFQDMQAAGINPDTRMYNILMAAYGKEGLTLHAAQLFRKMQAQGVTPDDVSFNTLIHAHCQAGQVDEAAAVYKLMLKSGHRANSIAQRHLATAYHDVGRHQQAAKLYRNSRP